MALDKSAEPRAGARKALRAAAPGRRDALLKGGGVARVMLLAAHELVARCFAVELVVDRTDEALRGGVPEQATVVELGRAAMLKLRNRIAIGHPGILLPLAARILLPCGASARLGHLLRGMPPQ